MHEGLTDGAMGDCIPEPGHTIRAAGDDGLAVRAERHGTDKAFMYKGLTDGETGGGVPEPCRLVITSGEDGLAVRAERHGENTVAVGPLPVRTVHQGSNTALMREGLSDR